MSKNIITSSTTTAAVAGVTHSGPFHGDDVAAAAAIAASTAANEVRFVRTRDRDLIEVFAADNKPLDRKVPIFDVGGRFSPEEGVYDHHFRGRPERQGDGPDYSGYGLVCKHHLQTDSDSEFAWHVDGLDNGQTGYDAPAVVQALVEAVHARTGFDSKGKPMSWGLIVHLCNPAHVDGSPVLEGEFNDRFSRLVGLVSSTLFGRDGEFLDQGLDEDALEAFVGQVSAWVCETMEAEASSIQRVQELVEQGAGPVLVLDQYEPAALDVLAEAGEEWLYAVFPGPSAWMVQQVAVRPGSFEGRRPLPEAWAGLRDEAFREATGVKDGVFCHPGRFICGAGSKEGALALAQLAV